MTPLVSVVITHHLNENQAYLQVCLDSILSNRAMEYEVLCVADTLHTPVYVQDKSRPYHRLTIHHRPDLNTASAKVNWAVPQTRGKYLWLVSDDVVVASDCMRKLVIGINDNRIICNPMSNSDNGAHFFADLPFPIKCSMGEYVGRDHYLEAITGSPWGTVLIPPRGFVSFYCTMMLRSVWDEVGELDERLDFRHNDQDYCMRAAKLGIGSFVNLSAFALHFGDKTLDKCVTMADRDECTKVFAEKWSGTLQGGSPGAII